MPSANKLQVARQHSARLAKACAPCHKKKIRCDVALGRVPCSNCYLHQTECISRTRRPRHTTTSLSTTSKGAQDASMIAPADQVPATDIAPSWPTASDTQLPDPQLPNTTSDKSHSDADGQRDASPSPAAGLYDGRTMYFGPEARTVESTNAYPETLGPSPSDLAQLETHNAFELPSRVVRAHYIDSFYKYCFQFSSVVKKSWLEHTATFTPSTLLLQAVLFAGSRLSSPADLESTRSLYNKAKLLFFSNYERNPIWLIISSFLLQWWNPTGPERVSIDNADFWHRIGIGIALQIGLHKDKKRDKDAAYHRRLWWALMARDCQLSAAHGRPRAIAPNECNVSMLTVSDLPYSDPHRLEFVSWVNISNIFGELGGYYRCNKLSEAKLRSIGNDLYTWIRELPPALRLFNPSPETGLNGYNFVARQLHIIYFTSVALLLRTTPSDRGSLLAASFTAALYEEFLVRDELRFAPAMHKFFLLTAGIFLLPASIGSNREASEDLAIVKQALGEFAKSHPSALATLSNLEAVAAHNDLKPPSLEIQMDDIACMLFREFGPGFCRQWDLYESGFLHSSTSASEAGRRSVQIPAQYRAADRFPEQGNTFSHSSSRASRDVDTGETHADHSSVIDTEPVDFLWPSNFSEFIDPGAGVLDEWFINWPDVSS